AFGTGEHVTTINCLGLIDEFQRKCPGASFLDAGCGSGILAIAAARLGFKPVHAIDNDPIAVKATRQNSVRNKVAGRVVCRRCDILSFKPRRKYMLITANLYANLLASSSRCLAGLLECNNASRLVISGILEKQYGGIKKAYLRQHLRETKKIKKQGWVTAVFKRKMK
ncbi:50S ribosomal protein L11 methyltransferase, partial [Verrucomicrobiota bacterium]